MERKYYTGEQILEALSEVGVGAGDTSEVLSYLGRLPSSEPKTGKWIPCSERLPEAVKSEEGVPNPTVLCCTSKKVFMGYYSHGAKCWRTQDGYNIREVLAWMECPELYKGEQ